MDLTMLRGHCLTKVGSSESYPFGPDVAVFKVAGRIFAICSVDEPLQVSVKCDPEIAPVLRDTYAAVRPGYHLNKRHWNTVVVDGSIPDAVLTEFVDDSYDLVVDALPRAERERLRDAQR